MTLILFVGCFGFSRTNKRVTVNQKILKNRRLPSLVQPYDVRLGFLFCSGFLNFFFFFREGILGLQGNITHLFKIVFSTLLTPVFYSRKGTDLVLTPSPRGSLCYTKTCIFWKSIHTTFLKVSCTDLESCFGLRPKYLTLWWIKNLIRKFLFNFTTQIHSRGVLFAWPTLLQIQKDYTLIFFVFWGGWSG